MGDMTVPVTMEIRNGRDGLSGSVSVFDTRFGLSSVAVSDRSMRAIGFDGRRLTMMELELAEDDSVEGRVTTGNQRREFTGMRTPLPAPPG